MKRMKLTPMKVIKYKFGNMDCIVQDDGRIKPIAMNTDFQDFTYNNEEHMLSSWTKRLSKLGRRLIKVYENGLERDITPDLED
jgi:hypothetical protein